MFLDSYNYNSSIVMDRAQMCRLIISRHQKLRSLRQQAANANNDKIKLFIAALQHLIQNPDTHPQAYQQTTQLILMASPQLTNTLASDIIGRIAQVHVNHNLDQHIILWAKVCNGAQERRSLPDLRKIPSLARVQRENRDLQPRFMALLKEFQRNHNQRNDERVQFFQDFDDQLASETVVDESRLSQIIYMDTMEIKVTKNKLLSQKLPEQAFKQQLNKLRHFVTINPPPYLPAEQLREFEQQKKWARDYLLQKNKNQMNVSINQTFDIIKEQQNISIVDKKKFQQKRVAGSNQKDLKGLQESWSIQPDKVDAPIYKPIVGKNKGQYPVAAVQALPVGTPLSDNSSLQIRQEDKSKFSEQQQLKRKMKQEQEDLGSLIVRKFNKHEQLPPISPKNLAATQNFFRAQQPDQTNRTNFNHNKTANQWGSSYFSPGRTKYKLSQFTSQKKQRKQIAQRQELSFPEQIAINPYLLHFNSVTQFCRFRRNCFQPKFTLFVSEQLQVNCHLQKETNSQLKVSVDFHNHYNSPIDLQVVYKIPKESFDVKKQSKITKRFTLHNQNHHVFTLIPQEFPLQACLVNLAFKTHDGSLKSQAKIPLPITILNFIEYLRCDEQEWLRQWNTLSQTQGLFSMTKHFEMDRNVVSDELNWILRQHFFLLGGTQGYSIQDYGCCCYYWAFNQLRFLMRLSLRVDNILSVEVIACRRLSQDEKSFISYCMNIWLVLLAKINT